MPSAPCWCNDGLVCEAHPDRPWPHPRCQYGAGIPCLRAECEFGRENLRVSILNWRLDLPTAAGSQREGLEESIADAESKLLSWDRVHHDD